MERSELMIGGHDPVAPVNTHVVIQRLPVLIAGHTYPMNVWAKLVSGPGAWTFGVWQDDVFLAKHPAIVTAKWTRFTWTMLLPAAYAGSGPLEFVAEAAVAGTILVSGLTITYLDPPIR